MAPRPTARAPVPKYLALATKVAAAALEELEEAAELAPAAAVEAAVGEDLLVVAAAAVKLSGLS
jgi:hypothetical protein